MVQAALVECRGSWHGTGNRHRPQLLRLQNGTTEVSCTDSTACSGATPSGYVAVTTNYTPNPLVPWPGMPGAIAVSRTAKMRVR